MEDSTIKAKYIYYDDKIKIEDFSKFRNITDLFRFINKDLEYNYGDLVAFSKYRDTQTYIIGKEGTLIKNPDYSYAGYLTIPYEITNCLDNALEKYSEIETQYIDLRFDDKFIKENINTKSCKILEKWNWKISYNNETQELYIDFSNDIKNVFNINKTSSNKILRWYNGSKLDQTTIELRYKIKKDLYNNEEPKLPPTWCLEYNGTCSNNKEIIKKFILKGPTIDKDKVINSINKTFKNINFEITEL